MDITFTIPNDKLDEIVEALCNSHDEEPSAALAKEVIINFIRAKVLKMRREKLVKTANTNDLNIS